MTSANQNSQIELSANFKNQNLPLARIKKIMEADQGMNTIADEAPAIFEKACEMFILDITRRSWVYTQQKHCSTIRKSEVVEALSSCDTFDFLSCLTPSEEERLDMVP